MTSREPLASVSPRGHAGPGRLMASIVVAMVLAAVVLLLLLLVRPPAGAVLPLLSIIAVLAGLILAGVACSRGVRPRRDRAGPYEVAGALLFAGFAAALMTDTELALAAFRQLETGGVAALPGN